MYWSPERTAIPDSVVTSHMHVIEYHDCGVHLYIHNQLPSCILSITNLPDIIESPKVVMCTYTLTILFRVFIIARYNVYAAHVYISVEYLMLLSLSYLSSSVGDTFNNGSKLTCEVVKFCWLTKTSYSRVLLSKILSVVQAT